MADGKRGRFLWVRRAAPRRPLRLRTKLVLWSAGSSLACAVALVVLQFVALDDILDSAFESEGFVGESLQATVMPEDPVAVEMLVSPATIRADVLTGLQIWSVALVAGFALVSTISAWLMARRFAGGVAALTQVASDAAVGRRGMRVTDPVADADIRVLGETLNRMLGRLDSDLARRELYAANASHELRTPIARARLALEIPLSQTRVPPELVPDLTAALAALEESERIVTSLLTLAKSRAQGGDDVGATPGATTVDLAEVAGDEIERSHDLAVAAGVRLRSALETGPVCGHPELLSVVVRNLLDNAVRHNRVGGCAWIETAERGNGVVVRVRNDGAVYDRTEVEWLVDPFHRGKDTRRSDIAGRGAGLGLSIAASIVGAHNGTLRVEARAEGGLDVTVTFPRQMPAGSAR